MRQISASNAPARQANMRSIHTSAFVVLCNRKGSRPRFAKLSWIGISPEKVWATVGTV